jgi:hypothetical protein
MNCPSGDESQSGQQKGADSSQWKENWDEWAERVKRTGEAVAAVAVAIGAIAALIYSARDHKG